MSYINKITKRLVQAGLTPRQIDFIGHMMEGITLKEIASRMYIAEKSAKFHNTCLIAKLKAGSRYGLIVLCYKMVLEELESESRDISENYFKLLGERVCEPIIEKENSSKENEEFIQLPRGKQKLYPLRFR